MDMRMPRMGWSFCIAMAIRAGEAGESNRNIPIAALTANVLPHDRERCSEVGMNDFLSKPLVEEELKACALPTITDRWGLHDEQIPLRGLVCVRFYANLATENSRRDRRCR